jgi:putative transcriptional regulator
MKFTSYAERRIIMKTRVKELRTKANLTQEQLAELVHVSSRTIISIEKGQYKPSLMLAYRMAQVFGTTVEDLCCLKENKELEDRQYEDL